MTLSNVIALLCGVALFLFGMGLMGDGLKKVAGSKLEAVLYKLCSTPWKGLLLGTAVTAVIQSSCATSVMVVGFVNAGMMQVSKAVGVVLGSILGTSITGWLISLSYIGGGTGWVQLLSTATLTGIVAVVGILLRMTAKHRAQKELGNIFLGFAVLMTGMKSMSAAVEPLKESQVFIDLLISVENPLIGILAGALITAILQSASAAVGILQALSVTGAISVSAAVPLLLGIGIGASVPVLLSAVGANLNGRRTALIYPTVEIISAVVFSAVFYPVNAGVHFEFMKAVSNPFSIAALNSVLRLIKVLMMMPFCAAIDKLITALVKAKPGETVLPVQLKPEERLMEHPAAAVAQTGEFMRDMANTTYENLTDALSMLGNFTEESFAKVEQLESTVDRYEDALGTYLTRLAGRNLTKEQGRVVTMYLRTISDFERISDHALNIAESAREISEKNISFSESALRELVALENAAREILKIAVEAFCTENVELAKSVEPLEDLIDDMCDEIKQRHAERVQDGVCTLQHGFVFNDMLTNLERISDHCSNVAVAVITLHAADNNTHAYLDAMKEKRSGSFEDMYLKYSKQFEI